MSASCNIFAYRPGFLEKFFKIKVFTFLMLFVIAVQGTYLGFIVGVQTSIERRFEFSSSQIGAILALYDVGHTVTVILVGHFGSYGNKPRWTALGSFVSSLAMFLLCIPHITWGWSSSRPSSSHLRYMLDAKCDTTRNLNFTTKPACEKDSHNGAFALIAVAQVLAGCAMAPFNTLAYVYIDEHVGRKNSPLYLGLLTSMYAFGPAIGFGLSALANYVYVDMSLPENTQPLRDNPNWVGAWWFGFAICSALFFVLAIPLSCFPKELKKSYEEREMVPLDEIDDEPRQEASCMTMLQELKALPKVLWQLLKNPVYTSMTVGWIFGAYLVGGFGTYLPKYIEKQYHLSSSEADIYAGIISIGSVAVSTAVGGYLLTRFNMSSRSATLYLLLSWIGIVVTYVIAMFLGCEDTTLAGTHTSDYRSWNFTMTCNKNCMCEGISHFDPVCLGNMTFFSPCHAGCDLNESVSAWQNCNCGPGVPAEAGFCPLECKLLPAYIVVMFVGLFIGNLFFMSTMVVILRAVADQHKALALSFSSFCTNLLGFIPAPIIFGYLIDTSCSVWHSLCDGAVGNCIKYDNADFRHKYHLGNALFQVVAVVAVIVTYFKLFTFKPPSGFIED